VPRSSLLGTPSVLFLRDMGFYSKDINLHIMRMFLGTLEQDKSTAVKSGLSVNPETRLEGANTITRGPQGIGAVTSCRALSTRANKRAIQGFPSVLAKAVRAGAVTTTWLLFQAVRRLSAQT
jgi:hypothetical protein